MELEGSSDGSRLEGMTQLSLVNLPHRQELLMVTNKEELEEGVSDEAAGRGQANRNPVGFHDCLAGHSFPGGFGCLDIEST